MRLHLKESDKYDWIRNFYSKVSPEAKQKVSKFYSSLLDVIEMYDEEIDTTYALATILGQLEDLAKDYNTSIEQLLNIKHELDDWSNSTDSDEEDLDESAEDLTKDLQSSVVTLGDGISLIDKESKIRPKLEALFNSLLLILKKNNLINNKVYYNYLFEDEEFNSKWVKHHLQNIGDDKILTAVSKISSFIPEDTPNKSDIDFILNRIETILKDERGE